MPVTRLTLLEGFGAQFDGEQMPLWPSAQRVVAWLAVMHHGRRVHRLTAAERLWPDSQPARGASSLRSVLWRLPRPRGRTIVLSDAKDLWLTPDVEVDLWEAEAMVRAICRPDAATRQPAADPAHDAGDAGYADYAVLRGDLLPEWEDPWLIGERESYRQKRLHALERAAAVLCEAGRFTDALDASLCAVQSEPLRETAHRRVIEVHLAEGNHAEALRQYDGYRRLLAEELGLPPSPHIRRLVAPLLGRPADLHADGR